MLIEQPPRELIQPILEKVKEDFKIRLSEKQEAAVNEAFRNNLSIITGSPGTGKTTVLKTILEVYRRLYPDRAILLMAPTGRASRNMAESTGYKDARTMHNALGIISEDDDTDKSKENVPLYADLIIVDEFSMVDMWLASKFFARIKKGAKLVLVGDPDQLPSVRPGNVFKDMISCGLIPVTVLDQIFRQSKDSFIAHNAKIINRGETNLFYGEDFQFINAKTQEETAMMIMEMYCQEAFERGVENVQILSPFRHRGDASSDQMNETLREIINPYTSDEDEVKVGGTCFRVGDRIMQNKNTPQVSNGDLGFIRGINSTGELSVDVDFGEDRKLKYRAEDMSKLELAYATTIHKAMGSEYEIVLIPMLKSHTIMLSRNLLYTGIIQTLEEKYGMWLAGYYNCLTKDSVYFTFTENEQMAQDLGNAAGYYKTVPPVSVAADDQTAYTDLTAALQADVQEFTTNYVINGYGDAEWTAWVQSLNADYSELVNILNK